jgi:hypothetical protein
MLLELGRVVREASVQPVPCEQARALAYLLDYCDLERLHRSCGNQAPLLGK